MVASRFMGRGDVVGPSSATDGALAAFDGTSGKLIKVGSASGVYVSSITGTANQITASAATGAVTLSIPSTFIAPGTIAATTTVSGTAGIFPLLTQVGGTVAVSTPLHTQTQTWNAAQTFIANTLDVTATLSNAGSLLHKWMVGGVNMFSVRKDGGIAFGGDTTTAWSTAALHSVGATVAFEAETGGTKRFELGTNAAAVISNGLTNAQFLNANGALDMHLSVGDNALLGITIQKTTGFVGIGKTNPSVATDVVGAIRSSTYLLRSVGNALTAVGTDRATALQLAAQVNNVTTAAAGTGVILPVGVIGMRITVFNAGANPIQVYASGSETIDGVAGATGVPLTNAKRCDYFFTVALTWISAQLGVVSA